MALASVADQDSLLLYAMASLRSSGARVNGMAVVKTAADRVSFDDLNAHDDMWLEVLQTQDRERMNAQNTD